MNILMIGNKESGKTTYMASAFGLLEGGGADFYIRTDTSSKAWLKKLYSRIRKGNYPDATDKRASYEFELFYNQTKVIDFNWIDYNGGIITEQSIDNLLTDINQSDGMMIFLDAEALWRNNIFVHKFRRIFALINSHLENSVNLLLPIVIVLTKYDRIQADITLDEVTENISNFLDNAKKNNKFYVRVVPVSCTKNGFYNVELPILEILNIGMKNEYKNVILEANAYEEEFQKYNKKRKDIIDWSVSRLIGVKTNKEIAEDYRQKALKKTELYELIENTMENLSVYINNYNITYPSKKISIFQKLLHIIKACFNI